MQIYNEYSSSTIAQPLFAHLLNFDQGTIATMKLLFRE